MEIWEGFVPMLGRLIDSGKLRPALAARSGSSVSAELSEVGVERSQHYAVLAQRLIRATPSHASLSESGLEALMENM